MKPKRDRILIEALRVDCIVGVYTRERSQAQPLLVDLELGLDTSRAGRAGRIAATCDYTRVADEVEALLSFRRYKLLEVAAEELAAMLLGVHPQLGELCLRLRKPEALGGRARSAGVEIRRGPEDLERSRERAAFGTRERLFHDREAELCLLHLDPGQTLASEAISGARGLEWLAEGSLERDGVRVQGFDPRRWDDASPRPRYQNPGTQRAALFCCLLP